MTKLCPSLSIKGVLVLCCVMGASLPLHAQGPSLPQAKATTPPPELTLLQQQYALRALAAGRMLADQYSNALSALESQAADAGDYDTALAAQHRRLALATLYSRLPEATGEAVVLRPSDAKTSGAVSYDRNEDSLINWKVAGSSAYWDLPKITPGDFDIAVIYSVADSAEGLPRALLTSKPEDFLTGGDVEVMEVIGLGGGDSNRLVTTVAPTGGWSKFVTVAMGSLKLTRPSTRLMIKVSKARGGGGVMHLREIRLTPARPHASAPDAATSTALAKLRADHEARLRELELPIVTSYKAKLQRIADQFASAKDDENAEALKMEAQRADHALAQTTATTHIGAQITAVTEGLEEIRDATFVDAPSNTGDQFLIMANGQQIPVRLLWVTCPSPLAEDKANHKFHSEYFGISMEDSVALGRQGQEFTAAYLKDKPLRVLTRWQKNKEGAVLASVQPADLGDYAGILVDNGLAAITPPSAKAPARRRTDENAVAVLKERESTARSKPLPPGAWSLSTKTP